jgi:hypothetical protein
MLYVYLGIMSVVDILLTVRSTKSATSKNWKLNAIAAQQT